VYHLSRLLRGLTRERLQRERGAKLNELKGARARTTS